jgi:AraC-like DNA-binding protein
MSSDNIGAGEGGPPDQRPLNAVIVRRFSTIVEIVKESGFEIAPILGSIGLPGNLFSKLDTVISFADLDRLLTACAEATGRSDIGFRIGVKLTAPLLGLSGLVAMNQPTVREAWNTISHSFRMTGTGSVVRVRVEDGRVIVGYEVVATGVTRLAELADGGAAAFVSLMRGFCGPTWRAREARLFRRPVDLAAYRRFFDCPISYGAPHGEIEFDEADLDLTVRGHNLVVRDTLAPLLDRALDEAKEKFESGLLGIMASQLARGKLNFETVASSVGISSRSLRRRLNDRGLSYAALADRLKFDHAKNLLSSGRPIADVADTLGYSDTASFVRAFKQWAGLPPGAWRASGDQRGLAPSS